MPVRLEQSKLSSRKHRAKPAGKHRSQRTSYLQFWENLTKCQQNIQKTVPCKPRTGSQTGLFSSHTLVVGFTVGSSKAAIIEGTFEFAVGTGDTASRLARANLFSVSVKEVFKVEASTFRIVQKKQRAEEKSPE